jgi:hypothetical protein
MALSIRFCWIDCPFLLLPQVPISTLAFATCYRSFCQAAHSKQLEEQQKKIADLERQLALRQQNSTTTSKPPSSDGLAGQQRVRASDVDVA